MYRIFNLGNFLLKPHSFSTKFNLFPSKFSASRFGIYSDTMLSTASNIRGRNSAQK